MKKLFMLSLLCLFLCVNQAQAGFIYEDTAYPILATDMKTDNIKNLKVGECQVFHCMGIVDTGHAGIQEAAKRGKITQIHHVDISHKLVLGIGVSTVRVYGE